MRTEGSAMRYLRKPSDASTEIWRMNTRQPSEEVELRDETGSTNKPEFLTYAKVFKLYNKSDGKSLENWDQG